MLVPLKHFVSVDVLDVEEIRAFFERVENLKVAYSRGRKSREWRKYKGCMEGQVLVSLFYQPSTRTRLSFEAAMERLGGSVIGTENAREFSSAVKGETLKDTIRTCQNYGDVIVMRHDMVGSAAEAASVSSIPVINAGDGIGEHPTQALLDFYTMWESFMPAETYTLTVVGDLKRGRTIHSLIKLINRLREQSLTFAPVTHINCIAPESLRLPDELRSAHNLIINEYTALTPDIVKTSDFIYMTRTQFEHGEEGRGETIMFDPDLVSYLKPNAVILHPLPRNEELPEGIDSLPQAKYFTAQIPNGIFVRMQLLIDLLDH